MAAEQDRLTGPQLPQDFADLITCLNEAAVDYMLVGGYAVVAHGFLRTTQDFDVWLRADRANAQRVAMAMQALGVPEYRSQRSSMSMVNRRRAFGSGARLSPSIC
jgi:hypothetical protein